MSRAFRSQPRPWRRWGVMAGLAAGGPASLLLANLWVAREAAPHLYDDPRRVPARDVALVPGARVHPDGRPYPVLVDRLDAARQLYEVRTVQRILVSGSSRPADQDQPEGMRRWLVDHGVPEADVLVDRQGPRTYETMRRAVERFGVRGAIVCTQRFHLARSVFLARHAGLDAVGLVAAPRAHRRRYRNDARELLACVRAFVDVHAG